MMRFSKTDSIERELVRNVFMSRSSNVSLTGGQIMKIQTVSLLVVSVLVSPFADTSFAQNVALAPISNWSYYNHASTAEEGFLRGQAAAVQAVGQAQYLQSLAAVNYAEATRVQIENRRLYVKTSLANREEVQSFRERYTRRPITKEQWQEFSKRALPDRLSSDLYSNGKIVWPHILRMDEYAPLRKRIDVLVANRTTDNSGDGSPMQRELASLVDSMKIVLRENIDTLSSSQYGNSKWFLICLDYEMKQPLTTVEPSQPATSTVTLNDTPSAIN